MFREPMLVLCSWIVIIDPSYVVPYSSSNSVSQIRKNNSYMPSLEIFHGVRIHACTLFMNCCLRIFVCCTVLSNSVSWIWKNHSHRTVKRYWLKNMPHQDILRFNIYNSYSKKCFSSLSILWKTLPHPSSRLTPSEKEMTV